MTGPHVRTAARGWRIFLDAGGLWLERNAFVHAGSLAFYTLFSMAPVVIIAVAIAGAIFGDEAANGQIVAQLEGFVGGDAARTVQEAVARSRPEAATDGRSSSCRRAWRPLRPSRPPTDPS